MLRHACPIVLKALAELNKQGFKLAVVTDGLRLKAWMRLNAAGLEQYFDVVVTHDGMGRKKPSAAPFKRAMAELHVKPGECLIIGDWPEKDMIRAKAAGMLTCWAKYGSRFMEGEADFILRDIKEIFKVVQAC